MSTVPLQFTQTEHLMASAEILSTTYTDIANPADRTFLHRQIQAFNNATSEDHRTIRETGMEPLDIFVRNSSGQIVAGLSGDTFWGWLRIKDVWVDQSLRRHNFGSQLVAHAEKEARARGCRHARLSTFSFQARGFYEKQGFRVVGALENYPAPHTFYWMQKDFE